MGGYRTLYCYLPPNIAAFSPFLRGAMLVKLAAHLLTIAGHSIFFASGGPELARPAFGGAAPLFSASHCAACGVGEAGFEPA